MPKTKQKMPSTKIRFCKGCGQSMGFMHGTIHQDQACKKLYIEKLASIEKQAESESQVEQPPCDLCPIGIGKWQVKRHGLVCDACKNDLNLPAVEMTPPPTL